MKAIFQKYPFDILETGDISSSNSFIFRTDTKKTLITVLVIPNMADIIDCSGRIDSDSELQNYFIISNFPVSDVIILIKPPDFIKMVPNRPISSMKFGGLTALSKISFSNIPLMKP